MIGVNGQYLMTFKINKYSDFIKEEQLIIFRLIEDVGNILPIFELIFDVYDDNIIQYLNQGNIIEVSVGINPDNMTNIKLIIFKRDKESVTSISTRLRITGFLSALKYNYTCKTSINNGSSVEVIKKVASNTFNIISNIDNAKDNMNWIQPNIPDRQYITNIWKYSRIEDNDLLLLGITSTNNFILKSLRNSLKSKKPNWYFQDTHEKYNDIVYTGTPTFIGDIGIYNHLTGYYKSRIIHDIDGDSSYISTPNITPILARSNKRDTIDMGNRLGNISIKTENTHDNYHKSYDLNITKLNSLNSIKAKVDILNSFFPIQILDTVLLKDNSGSVFNTSSEDNSGFWIVTKVARILYNRQFISKITLSRDGINNIQ